MVSAPVSTPIFGPAPCAMLVGIEAERVDRCKDALEPVPVIRVAHAQAAIERMLVTRPLVVVVRSGMGALDLGPLKEAAHDIGAQVVEIGEFMGAPAVATL